MRLKQGVAGVKLDQDTTYTPNIARVAPTQIENDFRGAVMSC